METSHQPTSRGLPRPIRGLLVNQPPAHKESDTLAPCPGHPRHPPFQAPTRYRPRSSNARRPPTTSGRGTRLRKPRSQNDSKTPGSWGPQLAPRAHCRTISSVTRTPLLATNSLISLPQHPDVPEHHPNPSHTPAEPVPHLTHASTHSDEPLDAHTTAYAHVIANRTHCRRQPEQDTPPKPHSAPASSFPVIVFQTMPARKRCTDAI